MRKSRFTRGADHRDSPGVRGRGEARRAVPPAQRLADDVLQMAGKVRRHDGVGCQAAQGLWRMRTGGSSSCSPMRCSTTRRSKGCWQKTGDACGAADGGGDGAEGAWAVAASCLQADRDLALGGGAGTEAGTRPGAPAGTAPRPRRRASTVRLSPAARAAASGGLAGATTNASSGCIARRSWRSAGAAGKNVVSAVTPPAGGARSRPTSAGRWTSPRTAWPTAASSEPPT